MNLNYILMDCITFAIPSILIFILSEILSLNEFENESKLMRSEVEYFIIMGDRIKFFKCLGRGCSFVGHSVKGPALISAGV